MTSNSNKISIANKMGLLLNRVDVDIISYISINETSIKHVIKDVGCTELDLIRLVQKQVIKSNGDIINEKFSLTYIGNYVNET